eukprot:5862791-Prymnesium_polylepis.1
MACGDSGVAVPLWVSGTWQTQYALQSFALQYKYVRHDIEWRYPTGAEKGKGLSPEVIGLLRQGFLCQHLTSDTQLLRVSASGVYRLDGALNLVPHGLRVPEILP